MSELSAAAASCVVRPAREVDEATLERFILGFPESLFYQSRRHVAFLADLTGAEDVSLVATRAGSVEGVLPLLRLRGPRGWLYNSLPFFGSNGGPLARSADARAALVAHYREMVTSSDALGGTIVENPLAPLDPTGVPSTHRDERIALLTRLRNAPSFREDLFASVESRTRRAVRKAMKEGVTLAEGTDAWKRFEEVHRANMLSIGGTPKPDGFFALVQKHFREGVDYRLITARKDGDLAAALLAFYFNRTVEYYTPVVVEEHRASQPLALLVFEAMVESAARGFEWWNWGGTWPTQEGVYQFKKQWAPVEMRYRYFVHLNAPEVQRWSRAEILTGYPGFYVVPFTSLVGSA